MRVVVAVGSRGDVQPCTALTIGKLDTDHLALRLRRLTGDERMRERAAEVGERIRAEDGVTEAVRVVESLPRS